MGEARQARQDLGRTAAILLCRGRLFRAGALLPIADQRHGLAAQLTLRILQQQLAVARELACGLIVVRDALRHLFELLSERGRHGIILSGQRGERLLADLLRSGQLLWIAAVEVVTQAVLQGHGHQLLQRLVLMLGLIGAGKLLPAVVEGQRLSSRNQ